MLFATTNKGKIKEIREIVSEYGLCVKFLDEAGVPDLRVAETGSTFFENAAAKAKAYAEFTGQPALSDDSGLEIDALGNEPGVDSALYMGADTPYEIRNDAILKRMENIPEANRTARFICVVACAWPDGKIIFSEGLMKGFVARKPAGSNGFGYDPIFYLPQYQMTSAELPPETKNKISHRAEAVRRMCATLAVL
ncbi:MAG: RdgB/HAM1 family non-canonical purine NTP pyrophosphatase [Defluviitaleaceae bacterium]|nr:RdgB/HAM1 family non-canonical purine NTP pyrophosphatase [Defluviitaleaceae bacterium]